MAVFNPNPEGVGGSTLSVAAASAVASRATARAAVEAINRGAGAVLARPAKPVVMPPTSSTTGNYVVRMLKVPESVRDIVRVQRGLRRIEDVTPADYASAVTDGLMARNAAAKNPRMIVRHTGARVPVVNDPELIVDTLQRTEGIADVNHLYKAGVRSISVHDWTLTPSELEAWKHGWIRPSSMYKFDGSVIKDHFTNARLTDVLEGAGGHRYYLDRGDVLRPSPSLRSVIIGDKPGIPDSFQLRVPVDQPIRGVQFYWNTEYGVPIQAARPVYGGHVLGGPGEFGLTGNEDAKGGEGGKTPSGRFSMSRNFLATDEVPETIFGIPVVSREEDYTEKDIAFFQEHPEAGGYYDLGDEEAPVEEAPVEEMQQDSKGGKARKKYPGSLNNPGNVGKHKRSEWWTGETLSPHERWAKFDTPQNGLNAAADAVRKIYANDLAPSGKPLTIRNYAYKYAPPGENDTETYIANLSKYSGIGENDELLPDDVERLSKLMRAKVRFESGVPHSNWFTDNEYRTAASRIAEGWVD